jgi:hypothetical protein
MPSPDPSEQMPSSGDGASWSVPASGTVDARKRARPWVHAVGLLLLLSGPVLFTIGLSWGDRSMDFPIPGSVRPGLYGFAMPKHWVCSDGHDHYSAPFWLGAIVASGLGGGAWGLLARRFRR